MLKQLVACVGRDNFLAGVRAYFGQHAWGNATLADLLARWSRPPAGTCRPGRRQWLETAGVNTLRPEYSSTAEGRFTEFAVLQEAPAEPPGAAAAPDRDRPLRPRPSAGLVRRRRVETDVAGERTEVPELVGERLAPTWCWSTTTT